MLPNVAASMASETTHRRAWREPGRQAGTGSLLHSTACCQISFSSVNYFVIVIVNLGYNFFFWFPSQHNNVEKHRTTRSRTWQQLVPSSAAAAQGKSKGSRIKHA
jgi:hypothetical protein